MSDEKKVGQPGYGVDERHKSPPPKPPVTNQPDWNKYLHPNKQRDFDPRRKGRPPETETLPNPTPKQKRKKDADAEHAAS